MKLFYRLLLYWVVLLCGCAGQGGGLLVQFDPNKPFDRGQLTRYCDMEDHTACLLLGEEPNEPLRGLPIAQGVAPSGRAVFAVLLSLETPARWFFREAESLKLSPLTTYRTLARSPSPFHVDQLQATGLEPGKTYELLGVDPLGQLLDRRFFQTLPPAAPHLRFALISRLDDHSIQQSLWDDLAAQSPELVFFLGDNVYATSRGAEVTGTAVSPGELWGRYAETRQALPFFRQARLVPVFAIWNDHDFGMLGGDSSYSHVDDSRETLEAFFPYIADAKSVLAGPGASHALKIAGQVFVLADNRSFRAKGRGEGASYLGRLQRDWILSLAESPLPLWILSGERWFGAKDASFESAQPGRFANFLSGLAGARRKAARPRQAAPVMFGSGQSSGAEIKKIPAFATYEWSSGFQAPVGKRKSRDARIVAAESGGYLLLESVPAENGGLEVKAQIRGPGGILFEKEISVPITRRKR